VSSLGYLNSIGITLSHSIETTDDTLTSNRSIVSSEILEVISIKYDTDGVAPGSGRADFEAGIKLAQIIRADDGVMSLGPVDMDASNKKTLTKELGIQAGLTLSRVSYHRVEDQSIKFRVLVDREESTELIKIKIINRDKEQGSNRVPFAIELKEVSLITVDLGFRDIRPF